MYYVYIVTYKNNSVLYIGVTGFLESRTQDHRERLIEGFTETYQATKLIYVEDYPDPRSAIRREKQLKGWRREKKIGLIQKLNPRWNDLFEQMIEDMDMKFFERAKRGEQIIRGPSTSLRSAQDDSFKKL